MTVDDQQLCRATNPELLPGIPPCWKPAGHRGPHAWEWYLPRVPPAKPDPVVEEIRVLRTVVEALRDDLAHRPRPRRLRWERRK